MRVRVFLVGAGGETSCWFLPQQKQYGRVDGWGGWRVHRLTAPARAVDHQTPAVQTADFMRGAERREWSATVSELPSAATARFME